MLSEEAKQVFDVLKKLTGEDGTFKVIEADEILEAIPNGANTTKVQLSTIIRDLRDRDYLKVKYLTPDEYCLLTLSRIDEIHSIVEEVNSVATAEPQMAVKKVAVVEKPIKRFAAFLWGFLGAILGGGVVATISTLLQIYLIK
ncbi:MAG: hypothetical protein RSB09_00805 [Clostridia bacterium]